MEGKKIASDLLLGWIIGLITVVIPQLGLKILSLKKQIRFLMNPEEVQTKKKGLFGWLRGKK